MYRKIMILFLFFFCLGILSAENPVSSRMTIVPQPAKMKPLQGNFLITSETVIVLSEPDAGLKKNAIYFAQRLMLAGGPVIEIKEMKKDEKYASSIILQLLPVKDKMPPEGYHLKISPGKVLIRAKSGAGIFYGIQSLLQLLPPEIMRTDKLRPDLTWQLPCTEIRDQPRFPYRGMHLDVSRHFFPKEFIKRYIDLIAMYKFNTFHWHLTDDNGWRIEIKKYPRLMQVAAWRVDRENLPWTEQPPQEPGEKATYGGYYTQDDILEIVQYANDHYVTIIPEIEMPAHSIEVLAAYPQFSCTGGPFTVPPGSYWPNKDILCAGNDSTFTFLEDVLSEVIELFPSKYIHIGGDEADKTRWEGCPKCQSRMKAEGLKDEKELQSYFIRRIEKFLISKNKKLIGWDEILEGGLAPEATVMSWRGIEGGIAAARQGHDVIMTPTSFCYFDYYQADPQFEPKAIGGSVTLKKVYSFEPVPEELTKEESKYILGAQGNLWTEYIPVPERAEYMAVPRMIALAEVVWTPKDARNWNDFQQRMITQFKRLDIMDVNYSRGSYSVDVRTYFDKKSGVLKARLESEQLNIPIRYTLNGDDPTLNSTVYEKPIDIKANAYIKAGLFVDGRLKEKFTERSILLHHATGRKVHYLKPYSYRYTGGGDGALTDGLKGTVNHRDGNWQGYLGNDMEIVIDLGTVQPVKSVAVTFLQNAASWIFFPDSVVFSLSSNGKRYHSINEYGNTIPKKTDKAIITQFSHAFPETPARYVRVRAKNVGTCPSWHEGKGEKCWLFVDETVVY